METLSRSGRITCEGDGKAPTEVCLWTVINGFSSEAVAAALPPPLTEAGRRGPIALHVMLLIGPYHENPP